jgi:hypothetical protein
MNLAFLKTLTKGGNTYAGLCNHFIEQKHL